VNLLFISGIDGFCHRYEVLHRAEQAELAGHATVIRSFRDPRVLEDLDSADALFVYRTPRTRLVTELLLRARREGRVILGSVDDLIFVDDPDALPPFLLDAEARATWLDGARRYRETLDLCHVYIAPSEPLAEVAEALGWPWFLHRDALSRVELDLGAAARRRAEVRRARAASDPSSPVVLGYYSGTATHDEDFATMAPALLEAMREDPRLHLLLVGPLGLPKGFEGMADRVETHARVRWTELPDLVARSDVNLAPLGPSRFAVAKGEGKYLEAAAVGVPTIASPTPAFVAAVTDGENGFLAPTPESWRSAIASLGSDPGLRHRLGERARSDVEQRYSPRARAQELTRIFAEIRAAGYAQAPCRRADELGAKLDAPRPGENVARVALEPAACPDLVAPPMAEASPPLSAGDVAVQRFRCDRPGLFRVDVFTITYAQVLDHELHLRLVREDGKVVVTHEEWAGHAPDRAWLALEFAAELDSVTRIYSLELRAKGTGSGNALSLGVAAPGEALEACRWNAALLSGPLLVRTFAAWGADGSGR
jgi:glycosyltransferase involved in cell wall biosynthesis